MAGLNYKDVHHNLIQTTKLEILFIYIELCLYKVQYNIMICNISKSFTTNIYLHKFTYIDKFKNYKIGYLLDPTVPKNKGII